MADGCLAGAGGALQTPAVACVNGFSYICNVQHTQQTHTTHNKCVPFVVVSWFVRERLCECVSVNLLEHFGLCGV